MTDNPQVSIIMPTYNRAAFITESIESIKKQSFTDWELIIVDDGSTDNTEQVVASIGDSRIQFHKADRISIGGKIKNIGLQAAKGNFIAFNDSDDLWAPTKLEKQIAALERHPDAGFCLCGGYNFSEVGQPLEYFYQRREGSNYGEFFLPFFRSQLPGFTQALLFRKECLKTTGTFIEKKSFSDVDFIATLAYHYKGVILYEPLVYRRLHEASYSNPNWIKSYYEGIQLINNFQAKLPKPLYQTALFKVHIHFGESYLETNQKFAAIKKFFQAWRYQPFSIVPLKKIVKAVLHLRHRK